ncbi:HNH endonuclease signature motif containing protein [Aquimarina sp. SS2-1]|uniref:HNH endonuclease signature motif containing protein n=1 Tax=Aquimarina besae TaxID=3342247 RepID=UPI00366F3720
MNRTPPADVQRVLREETGFLCAIKGCKIPYLEYHHFDPPWHIKNHHDPKGMIALCPSHHKKADANVFTKEELISYKANKKGEIQALKADFEYLRQKILLKSGNNLFYNNREGEIRIDGVLEIWFNTDSEGYKRLNIQVLNLEQEVRFKITDNVWESKRDIRDVRCPPNGKQLDIYLDKNEYVKVRFKDVTSENDLQKNLNKNINFFKNELPFTILEVYTKLNNSAIHITKSKVKINELEIKDSFFSENRYGINL